MKRKQIISIYDALNKCNLKGRKFTYIVSKNKKILEEEIKHMEEFVSPSDEFKEFKNKADELKVKYANKNEDGSPVIKKQVINGVEYEIYDIPNSKDEDSEFNKEFKELRDNNKDIIEEQRNKELEYTGKFLEEDVDIELTKISINDIPEDIDQSTMDSLFDIIEE